MIKFLKERGWAIWICFWLGYLGFGITTWQFWVIYIPLTMLVFISRQACLEESKVQEDPNPEKKDLDYFR